MIKIFKIETLDHQYDDIKDNFMIMCKFLEKYQFDYEYLTDAARKLYFNRLIKVLRYFKENKFNFPNTSFLEDTKWFFTCGNYINVLYAIYFPSDYIKEDEDDYLMTISNVIFKSSIGFLNKYGKNFDDYFKYLNDILKSYSIFHMILRRDLDNKTLRKREEHFFEIILGTFLAYYYVDYGKIENEKILNTINEMFHYREFLEKWALNGIDERYLDSYEKEKFIAKSLLSNINIKRMIIK